MKFSRNDISLVFIGGNSSESAMLLEGVFNR